MDFLSRNTLEIAHALLGKEVSTSFDGSHTTGLISEVEAYLGVRDKASHSYGGRRTERTETMYASGGTVYVYLCYGIHEMLNFVCGPVDHPHAILIRGIIPQEGLEEMKRRRNKPTSNGLSDGPGKVCQALGIDRKQNGQRLNQGDIGLMDKGIHVKKNEVIVCPRIGVDYAGEDAFLPYRLLWNSVDAIEFETPG